MNTTETTTEMTDQQAYEWLQANMPLTCLRLDHWVSRCHSVADVMRHAAPCLDDEHILPAARYALGLEVERWR